MAGLNAAGFTKKRLPEIKAQIEGEIRAVFGPSTDLSPESVFGQLVGIQSKQLADLWELAEQVYLSQYAASAEGVALEAACHLVGVSRLRSSLSTAVISATGQEGTVIPSGSLVRNSSDQFATDKEVVITSADADRVRIQVTEARVSQEYRVTISGSPVRVVATAAVPGQLAAQLAAAINAESLPASALADGDVFDLTAKGVPFSATVGDGLVITEQAAQILVRATAVGPRDVTANAIVNIVTPVAGWQSVTNRLDGVRGRLVEDDVALRRRRALGVRGQGSGSPAAIQARLLQIVPNLQSAAVFENAKNTVDEFGRPPKSFEVVVEGAENQDVADAIWRLKPAGIETVGEIVSQVTDAAGNAQQVRFNRPTPVYVFVRVRILSLYAEERLPADAVRRIQDAVAAQGNRLAVGVDVIRQRLEAAVYTVPGIATIQLTLASNVSSPSAPSAAYVEENLAISHSQRARFDASRVEVLLL